MQLPSDLRRWYSEQYWKGELEYHDHEGKIQRYHGPTYVWHGFEAVRDSLFKAIGKPQTLLDACCGGGDFVRRCAMAGVAAYGFDGSEYAIEHPSNRDIRDRLWVDDAVKLSDRVGTYEVVTAFDALEHFYAEDVGHVVAGLAQHATRHLVFCIGATDNPNETYLQKRGEPVPPDREWMVVSGHVTCAPWPWWCQRVREVLSSEWTIDWAAMSIFQIAMATDPRGHGADGRPLVAWGPNHVLILKRT